MRTTSLRIRVPGYDVYAAFRALANFERFGELAADVRTVVTHPVLSLGQSSVRASDWVVHFRRGLMRWNEWETVDADRLRIDFRQTEGDFAELHGFWQLAETGNDPAGFEVAFEITYDFGIESLAGITDPIAERVITRVICSVLTGLFGEITVLSGGDALVDTRIAGGA